MKMIKKLLPLLLCMMMVVTAFAVAASAADGAANVSMTVSATEVNVGDTVTVTVSCGDMTVSSFACKLMFDNSVLECTKIVGARTADKYAGNGYLYDSYEENWVKVTSMANTTEANNVSQVGFVHAGTEDADYSANTVFTATFTAKAAGNVTFTLVEDSEGADGYKAIAETKTLTIKGTEPACEHKNTKAVSNGDGTHNVVCAVEDCGYVVSENVPHDFTTGTSAHTCICGKVETFKLTVDDMADENKTFEVPYGANILEFIAGKVETGNVAVNTELHKGYLVWTGYWEVVDSEAEEVTKDDVMSGNLEICAPTISTGWERSEADDPWSYSDENGGALIGWNQIDGAWYYFIEDEVDGWHYRAEGLTRVPYPSVEINGVKYAPNQEDIDYFAAKGKEFMDATEAWFIFDENGKFQSDVNGKYEGPKATCYAVNGMIPWHYGLAKITNKYYYFVGDAVNGGNKVADGPVWVTRTNGVEGLEAGACYYFLGGVMANNLTDIVDGKYFENGKYMIGAGLVQVGEDYYYVRSSGKLATGKYYITKTNGIEGFETGMKLYFDETGKMLPIKNGVVEEGGALYFYQNNHMMCGAGLIEYKGAIYYVRSSGKVATGTYYITNTNGMEGFKANDKLLFGEDGKLIVTEKKDGIVEEGGALYYYENGRIAYNAGLLEIENGVYIYVRSNGQLAIGEYYVTNVNGLEGFEVNEKLFFGSDGKLTAN